MSAPIAMGAGNVSVLSSGLWSALAGAIVTFGLFLLQEFVKRSQDRRDRAATKDDERKERNLKLNQDLVDIVYSELRDNAKKLDDFLHIGGTPRPTMRVAGSAAIAQNQDLKAHLERHSGADFVRRMTSAWLASNKYNTAVSRRDAIPTEADDRVRDESDADVRSRAEALLRAFQSTPKMDQLT